MKKCEKHNTELSFTGYKEPTCEERYSPCGFCEIESLQDKLQSAAYRIQELEDELSEIDSIRCIYCGHIEHKNNPDKLVDHITTCSKSPLVQEVAEMKRRLDEFCAATDEVVKLQAERIRSLENENAELKCAQ